ncbi:MAG: zinc-dependent metalloprotease, partial [Pseudobdellovibrionaceae bacterium]
INKVQDPQKMDLQILHKISQLSLPSKDLRELLKTQKAMGGSGHFAYSAPTDESGWMDRVFQTLLEKPDMSVSEIHGSIAKEFLASKGNGLSETQRASLTQAVRQSDIRKKLLASLKNSPGCLKTEAEIANANYAKLTFEQAFRDKVLSTLSHEMGHSQGLTHNFIASYDKANYTNEDGTPSKRNYSSVMDYLTPGKFNWDGLGSYDIHAIRASHLGLLEVSPAYKERLGATSAKVLVNGKFIPIKTIQVTLAKNGWANFTKENIKDMLKEYKYCTDVDVGWDPLCQRHDFGSSVSEIVQSIQNDWEDNYINNYYSWDRNSFSLADSFIGPAWSQYLLMKMRKYMDETFYKIISHTGPKEEINDYIKASVKVYLFYNQLIHTPDTDSPFLSDRFEATAYDKDEKDEKGQPTGKTIKEVAVVEKRALKTISLNKDRVDTVGLEFDKIAALKLLTLSGFPSYKYYLQNMSFSFLDFEKSFMGMTPDSSIVVNTLREILQNKLGATFRAEDGIIHSIPGEYITVTDHLTQRAGIYGILELETPTVKDTDNFANLFKVGSSVGNGPEDRVVLSKLGTPNNSKTRIGYWALDNATASQKLLTIAASKNFFIQKAPEIQPILEKLIALQLQEELSKNTSPDKKMASIKKELVDKLTALNGKGEVVSAEDLKENPKMSIENQVEDLMLFNSNIISAAVSMVTNPDKVDNSDVEGISADAAFFADISPLSAVDQKALSSSLAAEAKALSSQKGKEAFTGMEDALAQLINPRELETSYGLIMKNIEFLHLLTSMTNPQYSR